MDLLLKPSEKLSLFFKLLPVQHLVMVTEKAVDARGEQEGMHRGCIVDAWGTHEEAANNVWDVSNLQLCAAVDSSLNRKSESIWEINLSFSVLTYPFPKIL